MQDRFETIWSFRTARFAVHFAAAPDDDLDLSFDDTGEVRQKLQDGFYCAFVARVTVELDGNEIATDYLGGCIYENPSDFIDHRGIKRQPNCGSYFSDMVRSAIADARKALCNAPKLRCA
jgi:hypothetical protein